VESLLIRKIPLKQNLIKRKKHQLRKKVIKKGKQAKKRVLQHLVGRKNDSITPSGGESFLLNNNIWWGNLLN
jgi:hypothetical protein